MKIKCVITDDEPMARKGLVGYIEKIDFLTLSGECENALQLNELLKVECPDLIFLDIEMPYINGIDFLCGLQDSPKVIITSAYEQYALKGYELNVIDYLLKPISFNRFLKAVNKAHEIFHTERNTTNEPHVFVKIGKQIKRIDIGNILYVESLGNYVVIHTAEAKEIVNMTLKNLLEFLPTGMFIQVHRSYAVQTDKVTAIEGNMARIGNDRVPISRNLKDKVFEALLGNRLLN